MVARAEGQKQPKNTIQYEMTPLKEKISFQDVAYCHIVSV